MPRPSTSSCAARRSPPGRSVSTTPRCCQRRRPGDRPRAAERERSFQKFNLRNWAQPLGDLSFQRAFLKGTIKQWFCDFGPSARNPANRTLESLTESRLWSVREATAPGVFIYIYIYIICMYTYMCTYICIYKQLYITISHHNTIIILLLLLLIIITTGGGRSGCARGVHPVLHRRLQVRPPPEISRSEKGEVLLRNVGTLRYVLILRDNSACQVPIRAVAA